MTDWIVFYDNGDTFSSDDGEPKDAPTDGVIVVAVSDIMTGRTLWHSADFYCWHDPPGEWVPHNQRGLDRFLALGGTVYLAGYTVPNQQWQRVYRQALDDDRMAFKTAWSGFEQESYAPQAEREALEEEWEQTARKPKKGK